MYTNADVTLYLYSKEGKAEKYIRRPVEGVYWEDVKQSIFLKTGLRDTCSVLLIIPLNSLDVPVKFTQGKDLVIKGIVEDNIDCNSPETISKSLTALKSTYGFQTVITVDERLYGSESAQHYELACK